MSDAPYKMLIGLEVHVQLKTRSKLFCGCSTQFGADPNTQTCPVCTGMPGALPVLNRQALQLAAQTALALNCSVPQFTKWDRKNYFYPDLPKGYQISQFDLPMSEEGYLQISAEEGEPKRIGIIRAHLEEDAGKSMHDEAAGTADSRIDLNRTGTPLLEIVSHPDMNSPAEARGYLDELKLLLQYLNVSDCNMQEGSLRVDANVNIHVQQDGDTVATPIVEVKNVNSFRAVERAVAYEGQRQYEAFQQTGQKLGDVPKQTRGWDDQAQVTRAQREKEESSDYRYFPDPDLVPVTWSSAEIDAIRDSLGELPQQVRSRLRDEYELDAYDADVIVNQGRAVVTYFEHLAQRSKNPKRASNWLQQDVMRWIKESASTINDYPIQAEVLANLLLAVEEGTLDTTRGREVLERMIESGDTLEATMEQLGIRKMDVSEIEDLCRQLLEANPSVVQDVREGKVKAIGALIGQARKQNPNADPNAIRETCLRLIGHR